MTRDETRDTARVWLWLGASLLSSVAVVTGIAYVFGPHPGADGVKAVGGAVLIAGLLLRQSRTESGRLWKALPTLKAETFRYILLPHLLTCVGGLVASACLILVGGEERVGPKAWSHSVAGVATLISMTLGGALISLMGLLWGKRRRAAAGLR